VRTEAKVQALGLLRLANRAKRLLAVGLVEAMVVGSLACAGDSWPTGRSPNDPSNPSAPEAPLHVAEATSASAVLPPSPAAGDTPKGAPPNDAGVIYTCPMHPEVRSDTPGHCPKCGMNLVPKTP
jgi:hypothetical protein